MSSSFAKKMTKRKAALDMLSIPDFPARLTLELTNQCNYMCAMCPSRLRPEEPRGHIPAGLFRRLMDEAADYLPVALVPFFRGESLLHPEMLSLLSYAKQRGLGPIQLASNGALLDEDTARGLLDLGLDFLSFSIDSNRPEEYAQIRRGGELNRVKQNIARFLELRDAGGYATEVQVSATRLGSNGKGIAEFVHFWREKADRTRIYYEHSADGHTGSLNCPEVPKEMPRRACHKLFEDMVVYFDGRIALCNHDWYRQPPLGDAKMSNLYDIWHDPAYEDLRRQHLDPENLIDETCLHCDHWKIYYLEQPFIGELYTKKASESRHDRDI